MAWEKLASAVGLCDRLCKIAYAAYRALGLPVAGAMPGVVEGVSGTGRAFR